MSDIARLNSADVAELEEWGQRVRDEANGWAERAEASRGQARELTKHLDAIASKAAAVVSLAQVLNA